MGLLNAMKYKKLFLNMLTYEELKAEIKDSELVLLMNKMSEN